MTNHFILSMAGLVGFVLSVPVLGSERSETPAWNADGEQGPSLTFNGITLLSQIRSSGEASAAIRWDDGAIVLEGQFPSEGMSDGIQLHLQHHIDNARHIWIPHLTPADGYVMGDHAFRSPAIVLANEKTAMILVPDLDDVADGHEAGWRSWMDYNHPQQSITLAAGDYRVAEHVLYRAKQIQADGQSVRLRFHVRCSSAKEDLQNPYRMAARFIWDRWGEPQLKAGGSQKAPLDRYADYVVKWAFSPEGWGETVWQEFEIDGRRCGGPAFIVDVAQHPSIPVDQRKWREQRSIWNQAWFSNQRCANGLYRYARDADSEALMQRAQLSTNLALSAPQRDGLFPAVYTTAQPGWQWYSLYKDTPGWDKGHWTNSDRRPGDASAKAYHLLDAAFTARLLLEWDEIVGGDREAREYVTRFADRLCKLQLPSGAFPGWVEPDGKIVDTLKEGPESAMSATLLLELADRFPNRKRYAESAKAALSYLEKGPVAEGRWEDFETYFSCCRWGTPGQIVQRNGIYKQNTFSPFWSAEAFLAAYQVLGDEHYLAVGQRCLDELSLFQQVWDPPFIPAACHGGFGVMNADGEWNDARQSLFAPLYLEYYNATGLSEYFERGVAALRASFAMMYCPENAQVKKQYELRHPIFGPESYGFMMENIAHTGPAPADGSAIGVFTIYTWGNGAALATAAKVNDMYGDVFIDTGRKKAFGIDGCVAEVQNDQVRITDRYERQTLHVVYSTGKRTTVALDQGVAMVPLEE